MSVIEFAIPPVRRASKEQLAEHIAETPCSERDCPVCGAPRGTLCRNENGLLMWGVCVGRFTDEGGPITVHIVPPDEIP